MEVKMNRLNDAINEIVDLPNDQKVKLKNKYYTQVATRTSVFRKYFGTDANIKTKVIFSDLERVVVEAVITIYQDGQWREVANGYAEEFRNQGPVNRTSAIENCETSAIGRALANLGLDGGEYASAFEVDNAVNNKAPAPDLKTRYVALNEKKAKMVSFSEIGEYIKWLRDNLGSPKTPECRALWSANASTIIGVLNNLPEEDGNRKVFNDLVEAYESLDI